METDLGIIIDDVSQAYTDRSKMATCNNRIDIKRYGKTDFTFQVQETL